MLYPELFRQFEAVRWDLESDVPWDAFDGSELSDEQARTIKMNAITEWAALPATEMRFGSTRSRSTRWRHERGEVAVAAVVAQEH